MGQIVLFGRLGQVASLDRSIIYRTLELGEAPPSAIWNFGVMSSLHKL